MLCLDDTVSDRKSIPLWVENFRTIDWSIQRKTIWTNERMVFAKKWQKYYYTWHLVFSSIFKNRVDSSYDCHHHHHHFVVPLARISLTLSRHFSLSFIASDWSSGLHPVSSHSCCMYVRAGRFAFAAVHRSTSLMSSSLLLQQCSVCLVRLAWIVFVIGGR